MKSRLPFKQQLGFTLIEMAVSLAVFSVVVTIAVGALLSLIGSSERLQEQQTVMTTLSFALDSMTREIRTGYNYFCASRPTYTAGSIEAVFAGSNHESIGDSTRDCENGNNSGHRLQGISFFEGGDSISEGSNDRILYFFDRGESDIYRRVGDGPRESIVSSGIQIRNAEFFVTDSARLDDGGAGSVAQPTVTIFIEAAESNDPSAESYYVQTTVTQRTLDL